MNPSINPQPEEPRHCALPPLPFFPRTLGGLRLLVNKRVNKGRLDPCRSVARVWPYALRSTGRASVTQDVKEIDRATNAALLVRLGAWCGRSRRFRALCKTSSSVFSPKLEIFKQVVARAVQADRATVKMPRSSRQFVVRTDKPISAVLMLQSGLRACAAASRLPARECASSGSLPLRENTYSRPVEDAEAFLASTGLASNEAAAPRSYHP